jgi:hypothetical protein
VTVHHYAHVPHLLTALRALLLLLLEAMLSQHKYIELLHMNTRNF